jgi:hypothetical protein
MDRATLRNRCHRDPRAELDTHICEIAQTSMPFEYRDSSAAES